MIRPCSFASVNPAVRSFTFAQAPTSITRPRKKRIFAQSSTTPVPAEIAAYRDTQAQEGNLHYRAMKALAPDNPTRQLTERLLGASFERNSRIGLIYSEDEQISRTVFTLQPIKSDSLAQEPWDRDFLPPIAFFVGYEQPVLFMDGIKLEMTDEQSLDAFFQQVSTAINKKLPRR